MRDDLDLRKLLQEARITELEKRLDETRSLNKSIKAAVIAIFMLILTNLVGSFFQIQAERSRQVFSAKTDLLQSIIRETGSLEEEARKLQWRLVDEESMIPPGADKRGLLYAQARIYKEQARDLLQRFQSMAVPREWKDSTKPQGIAKQKAWYELFALITCLEKSAVDRENSETSPVSSMRAALDYGIRHKELTLDLANEIEKEALATPPCADKFSPEVFQSVQASASAATWEHFEGGWLSWLF